MGTSNTTIHTTLARSYIAYFLFSLLGLLADSLIHFDVSVPYGNSIALACFILGPMLMFWAQATSNVFHPTSRDTQQTYFMRGPYRYMRNPTHLGIVILVIGYAAVSGSIIFLAITILGYVVSNTFFKRYEKIAAEQYGEQYSHYKSDVPKIL